jgi:spore maturation protein CgeB
VHRNDAQYRARFSEELENSFLQAHKQKPFDLFFSYLMDGMVNPGVIDKIRKMGVPTCNFSCNNIHQFYLIDELSPHFDYNLHSEKDVGEKFLKIGANPIWWPMASNPKYFKPVDEPHNIEASFVGGNYALRAKYVSFLLHNRIDVHAYGPGWASGSSSSVRSMLKHYYYLFSAITSFSASTQYSASARLVDHDLKRQLSDSYPNNVHLPVPDEKLIALYSQSKISLGFLEVYNHHDPSQPVTQHLHLREFEAPMCGALYCTGYTDELAEMFEPDKEVVTYRNQYELLDKVRYYLSHPAQAEQVRQAGRKRALAEHTYHARFQKLFKTLGLPK